MTDKQAEYIIIPIILRVVAIFFDSPVSDFKAFVSPIMPKIIPAILDANGIMHAIITTQIDIIPNIIDGSIFCFWAFIAGASGSSR